MIDIWTVVRFLHVLGAIIWVGGQLTITVVVLPPVRRLLGLAERTEVLRTVGKRFALITAALFLPAQITTGVLLAWRHGVTWAALVEPGYGRVLAAKLILFTLVMAAATVHGIAQAKRRPAAARAASITALVGSLGVILLGTGLVGQ
ncbi:hypothetical protein [Amycolatopsis keratiniphila]|uniref:Copper resistance protein D domain-containing protein n=1 Tax=Amycolatopsis keratiniphila subsp. keratiniphila TaxID=227715 RepID=A0A1W2M156_9PSEU|nr:hypothetical protein [Amycolatopsis keratiniphila]ONF73585.1 hypothetical protein AVR91_0205565 [Amycolatopsis keratiniphila subsp. keratiniphila]